MQNVLTLGAIVKKCKELLGGADVLVDETKPYSIEVDNDGHGQTVYKIKSTGPAPTDGKRNYSANITIPPDGKLFAEWNRFKDLDEILSFINQ